MRRAGIDIPKKKSARLKLISKLAENVRAQTGQRENISKGLERVNYYRETLTALMDIFEIPPELINISFLESSFNPDAKSKVGATGAWQFMRHTGKHFMRIDQYVDQRLNPVISSISAFHLLKQNFQILKDWSLAIAAYNSGTKHLLRARRKLMRRDVKKINLEKALKNYSHPHIGFASENFLVSSWL